MPLISSTKMGQQGGRIRRLRQRRGARAVEQLRLVMAEVQIATVRNQVLLSMFTDFENFSVFKPASQHEKSVNAMLDQVIAWGSALKTLREKQK
jgi:NAD(P)H-dependent FMN reductase